MNEMLKKPTDTEYAEFLQEALKVIEAYKDARVYFNVTPTFTIDQVRRTRTHINENIAEVREITEQSK